MMKNINEDLPDSAYLYVKDGVKKLPYRTKSGELDWDRIPLAVAAVTVGYRGQVVDLPLEERKRIARKLLSIYREADKEPPESLIKFLGMDENSIVRIQDRNEVRIEDVDEENKQIKCLLHHAGLTANGVYYSEKVLAENYIKWNNVRCFNGHDFNHKIDDIVGVFTDVRYENGNIYGRLNLVPKYNWLIDTARVLMKANSSIPLSSVIDIDAEFDYNNQHFVVRNINSVESVDIVVDGATQSRFLEINSKRSEGAQEETMPEQVIETKETVEKVDVNEVETSKSNNTTQVDFNAFVKIANQNTMHTLFSNYDYNEFVKQNVAKYVDSQTQLIDYNALEAYANKLNEEFVKSMREYIKQYHYSPATVESDTVDKMRLALEGFFFDKDMVDANNNRVKRYTSFREFYEDLTGDKYITGRLENIKNKQLFAAFCGKDVNSLTSDDFANVLSNYMYRRLVDEYNYQNLSLGNWRAFVDVVPVRDFRPQYRVRYGGYGDLPVVAEGANYENLTELTDEQATYAVQKRGGTEDITLEMIANDDVGAIRRIPVKLARAAARTLHKFVMNELIFNNPTIYDGQALFSTTRTVNGNTVANRASKPSGAAYSIVHVRDARVAMYKFPELNSNERIGIYPRYIIVPADLEDLFYGMLNAERYPRLSGTANTENFPPNDTNWAQNWRMTVLVNAFAPANDVVVFVADKADVPTIELGFFGGEEPDIIVQDRPDVGSMFAADKITYKIRHVYGGAVLDFRAFYAYM